MSRWKQISIGEFVDFNPSEKIKKGELVKKISMAMLTEFERKIKGFEFVEYKNGPKFRNGDTLVAKITPCLENGKTAKVDILDENEVAFGSSEFIVLRENDNSISDYIFYLAKSPVFRERAIGCMEGTSGRKRVNEEALKRQEIKVPDKITQQKNAYVLSSLDDKIELNNKINLELENMAKAIYDYWFVQFDFPNSKDKPYKSSGGKMVWNEMLKREVPNGWEAGIFDDLGTILGGSTPSKDDDENFCFNGTPWITPKDLSLNSDKKFISRGEIDVSVKGLKKSSLKLMPKGTVLLSSRAPIGYLAIATKELTTNQGFKSFIPNKGYSSEYIYYTLKSSMKIIEQNASGSTFKEISGGVLKSIPVLLPNKMIIQKFNNNVEAVFKRQNILELQNQELASLRDWLLPMLMNGQVSVGKS